MRSTLKGLSILVTVLLGPLLLFDAVSRHPSYGIPLVIAAAIWLVIHVRERDAQRIAMASKREALIVQAFGIPEKDLRAMTGLSEDQVSVLLDDPVSRADFAARMDVAFNDVRAMVRKIGVDQ